MKPGCSFCAPERIPGPSAPRFVEHGLAHEENPMRSCRFWGVLSSVVLSVSTMLWCQAGTASLRGIVSDAKGAVLTAATATLHDPQTGFTRTVQTESDGTYQFLQIPPSAYTLEVSAPGFATQKRENLRLLVNSPATMNVTMQVAAALVEVEVTSEAPLVNTQDASIGNAFNARQLIDLPSEGRDPVSILSLQPGVTYIGSQVDQTNDTGAGQWPARAAIRPTSHGMASIT